MGVGRDWGDGETRRGIDSLRIAYCLFSITNYHDEN